MSMRTQHNNIFREIPSFDIIKYLSIFVNFLRISLLTLSPPPYLLFMFFQDLEC